MKGKVLRGLRDKFIQKIIDLDEGQEKIYLALTLLTGMAAAGVAVSLTNITHFLSDLIGSHEQFTWKTFLGGGLFIAISGWLTTRKFPSTSGSGIPGVRIALAVYHGKIKIKDTLAKFLVTVLSLSSGVSMGREGPTVAISAGIGSYLGSLFLLSKKRVKALVAVGSAGGIAAAFNTPISAVVFTLEEVVGDLNAKVLGSIVIASVVASVMAIFLTGNEETFSEFHYRMTDHREFILYLILGLVSAVMGSLWQKTVLFFRKQKTLIFKTHELTPMVVIFLLLGVLSFFHTGFLGSGHLKIEETLLTLILDWKVLLLIFSLKFIATSLCYATGLSGGLFMPTLLMGATLGSLVGTVGHLIFPDMVMSVGPYALVGMGAFFVTVIRAPFTSILMIFELTKDYQIILPLMIANIIAYIISSRYLSGSIYEEFSAQDGVHLPSRDDDELMESLTVDQAMEKQVVSFNHDVSINEATSSLVDCCLTGFPVLKNKRLYGMISRVDINLALRKGEGEKRIDEVCTHKLIKIYPDQSLLIAFHRLKEFNVSRLPVVSRLNQYQVIGIITAENIVSSFGYHVKQEEEDQNE